jgi:hypothetical protein
MKIGYELVLHTFWQLNTVVAGGFYQQQPATTGYNREL